MRGRKSDLIVLLATEQREVLEYWSRCPSLPAGLVRRARAVLLLAEKRSFTEVERLTGLRRRHLRKWVKRFLKLGPEGLRDAKRPGRKPVFSPRGGDASGEDGLRTAGSGRALAVAVGLVAGRVVESISHETVRRILQSHHLRPWRHHLWLSPDVPRDEAFCAQVREICDAYTRELAPWEIVLCVDEKTSIQPRPRTHPTLPAAAETPIRLEHEYRRDGALNLFAAFDTRTGKVYGRTAERKRQVEFIAFLEQLDRELPPEKTVVHVVLDNLRMHKGKQVQAWLAKHPRFVFHHPPVHCSWMNQVEQWFGILQRKRLGLADFPDKATLAERLAVFIAEWNQHAHPFNWSSKSAAKVMAWCQRTQAA